MYTSEEEMSEKLKLSRPQREIVSTSEISDKISRIVLIYKEVNEKKKQNEEQM